MRERKIRPARVPFCEGGAKLIRFRELTEDEIFCTEDAAKAAVTFENSSTVEPLVVLGSFGPEVNPDALEMVANRNNRS